MYVSQVYLSKQALGKVQGLVVEEKHILLDIGHCINVT